MDNQTINKDLFYDFCGGVPLWDSSTLDVPTPRFSACFNDVITLAPCGFIWIGSPFFVLYMFKCKKYIALPFSVLSILKGTVSFVLACLVVLQLIFQEHYGNGCDLRSSISDAGYTSSAIKFLSFVLTIVLQQVQRRRGIKTSGFPFVFWMLLIFCEIIPLYTHIQRQRQQDICGEDVIYFLYFIFICVQFVIHCFAERHTRRGYDEFENQNQCPEENTSILNHILFSWLTSMVLSVYRRTFSPDRFWDQTPKLKSDTLGPLLEEAWQDEVNRCLVKRRRSTLAGSSVHYNGIDPDMKGDTIKLGIQNGKTLSEKTPLAPGSKAKNRTPSYMTGGAGVPEIQPNLYHVIIRTFWPHWMEATLYMLVGEALWLLQPVVLQFIIDLIEAKTPGMHVAAEWEGYVYSVLLFLVLCTNSFIFHIGFHHMMTVGLRIKTALICLIYKKALTMKRSGTKATTVGEIVNLMSVDCQRIQDALVFSFYIIVAPTLIAIATAQFWVLLGVASLGGLAVICILFPTMGLISIKQYRLQKQLLYLKGDRIKVLNEVLNGIKVLKMYAWEPSFMKKITGVRNNEIRCLLKYALLTSISIVFAIHSPFMINFVLVLIRVLTSPTHTLGASEAFTALAIVNILRYPIALCPFLINGLVQATVSVERIQEFLRTDDISTDNVKFVQEADFAVKIEHGNFSWTTDNPVPILRDINLHVEGGELVAVVGQVGSGKSSLMAACLGELERITGHVTVKGKVAYVPQEAWIQNLTLRDNILFGRDYKKKKYDKVLDACALLPDLKILAGGDMTEIGEKGINISGGQKQRVSLARAVYNNADVYFLDDPLSAVDSHVGKHLFQKVIGNEGLLRKKTRILVTHGVHWLPMVDRIIVLTDGAISESGTYSELVSHEGEFARFLSQYLQQEDPDDETDPDIQRIKAEMRTKVEDMKSDGGLTSDDDILVSGRRRRYSSKTGPLVVRPPGAASRQKSEDQSNINDVTRLTVDEVSEEGAINLKVLITFVKAMGPIAVLTAFLCVSLFQGLNIFSNFWLTYWTEDELLKNTSMSSTEEYNQRYQFYLFMYLGLGVIQGILVWIGFYLALTRMVIASKTLHSRMLSCILRSPMSFFDTTPIGRMMNRFSSDVDIMDNKLPESFRLWTIMLFSTAAVIIVVSVTTPIFIAAIIPIAIFYVMFVRFYLPSARTMRRTESVFRSPIYNHFSETITGAGVIRAYRCGRRFVEESRRRIDRNIKFFFASNTGSRWIGIRLELLGNFIVLLATTFALASDELNGAQVGLSITYAVQITITMNLVVLAISEMEMNVVSAERVTEYTTLPAEASWVQPSAALPSNWPSTGKIEFRQYVTRYREGLDLVLKGIDCTIADGEKVGIVGRTGAGKSSLTLCLFRLIEAAGGSILIDGVDVSNLGLHDLRSKLTILPQDPVLFSGSLRANLDPFGRFDDASVWYAIECAHLKDFVHGLEEGLDYECGEGGQNLSVGQRQLVCLARTLLHKTKVLILDEATAAVDMETDDLIQETIRTQFKECTIITVAHRLNTILDYDRVMVLDAGLIKEFDAPDVLLKDDNGVFHGMAKDAGLV